MVKIRLRRTGKTKQPHYRVVVADTRSPRDGKFIEIIGYYSPTQQPKVLHIKADRARYWLGVGAQTSDTVTYLFKKEGIFDENGNLLPPSESETDPESQDVVNMVNMVEDSHPSPEAEEPIADLVEEEVVA